MTGCSSGVVVEPERTGGPRTTGRPLDGQDARPPAPVHLRPTAFLGPLRRPSGDAGIAAVLVLSVASLLVLVGAVLASLAAVAVARQRAASAADLSALAAAERALEGQSVACERAGRLARSVQARLTTCRLEGDVAVVVAEVRPPGALGRIGSASARARAGPRG